MCPDMNALRRTGECGECVVSRVLMRRVTQKSSSCHALVNALCHVKQVSAYLRHFAIHGARHRRSNTHGIAASSRHNIAHSEAWVVECRGSRYLCS